MGSSEAGVRLFAEPIDALNDESLIIRIEGLSPGSAVSIRSHLHNAEDTVRWSTEASFRADQAGTVDLSRDAPIGGEYAGADPNALIWSLRPEAGTAAGRSAASGLEPLTLDISVVVDDEVATSAQLVRRAIAQSVSRQEIRESGLAINLFLPDGDGPLPTVVVLGGSGGGFADNLAALLASHGYAAVSVAYFAVEGLPAELINIPLEYFEQVVAWIADQPNLDSDHLSVTGVSRGGELALLLASRYPVFRSVVAWVPSGYVWGAVSPDESDDPDAFPSWTYRGRPIPYVARIRNDAAEANVDGIVDLSPAFHAALQDRARADAATIEVENINGPVLLISGRDDALWPSAVFADLIVERLRSRGFDFEIESLAFEGAGHTIGPPIAPATITQGFHPIRKVTIGYGGIPAAIAAARAESWPRVLAFLERNVKSRSREASLSSTAR